MSSPLSGGVTPVYGLRYILEGQPARFTRQYLEENAKAIEAALIAGGIAPPGTADLLAAVARIGALEALTTPTAWTALTLVNGYTVPAGYQAAQYRKVGDVVELRGTITGIYASGQSLFTLPAGHRPPGRLVFSHTTDATAYGRWDVNTTGIASRVQFSGSTTAATYVPLNGTRFSVTA